MKPRLFCYSDAPVVPTGFGTVAQQLYTDLNKHFDTSILGINYTGLTQYDRSKYFLYPTEPSDMLGSRRFLHVLRDANPDIIFLFQDHNVIAQVLPLIKDYNDKIPVVVYTPVDAQRVPHFWKPVYEEPDKVIMYTNWAKNAAMTSLPDMKTKSPIGVLYHGVSNEYYPLPRNIVNAIRANHRWDDKFVILSNNRFQPRKALPSLLRAHALFAKGYIKCSCGNYYLADQDHCDLNGCQKSEGLEKIPGKKDVMMYLHANNVENVMGQGDTHTLSNSILEAGFTAEESSDYVSMYSGLNIYMEPYTVKEMNLIYNCADVNISASLGEGFGLSLIEAMASGTRSIAPNNSAIPEVLGGTGRLVKNSGFYNMATDNGFMRPTVSIPGLVDALEAEYTLWMGNGRNKVIDQDCINLVKKTYQWEDKRTTLTGWLRQYV